MQQMTEDHATDPMNVGESLRFVVLSQSYEEKKINITRQIAGSDVIVLNKIDLVSPEALTHTEHLINQVNPAAPIYRTVRGEINLEGIIGISAYSRSLPPMSSTSTTTPHAHTQECDHPHGHNQEKTHINHYEFREISSLRIECPRITPEAFDKFDQWIRTVLWENRLPDDSTSRNLLVLRCKGFLSLTTGKRYILQGVRSLYEMDEVSDGSDTNMGIPDEGKIVLIGKGLDGVVRSSLEAALNS